MKSYMQMSREELLSLKASLEEEFKTEEAKGLSLNMARGKPGASQLALSMPMLDVINSKSDMKTLLGNDTRNYGDWDGIGECRQLLADMMEVKKDNVIICGNSSLNIMYDTVARSMIRGVNGSTPWCKLDKVKFLCPVPGYDRHFKITELFGIEMINIPMDENGPDMDLVEKYVNNDEAVKGIWCVPKYSNPTGITYSDEVVKRFANLHPKAEDFRIFWDNAYCIHHIYDEIHDKIPNILEECEKAGNPDMVYMFEAVLQILQEELKGLEIGSWVKPRGGYFISFNAMPGCAKAIVDKCKQLGVVLTGAGATYPYGKDPEDSNIRIAPSFPTPEEMAEATKMFVLCVKLASVEKLLND